MARFGNKKAAKEAPSITSDGDSVEKQKKIMPKPAKSAKPAGPASKPEKKAQVETVVSPADHMRYVMDIQTGRIPSTPISLRVPTHILDEIEKARGRTPRNKFFVELLRYWYHDVKSKKAP